MVFESPQGLREVEPFGTQYFAWPAAWPGQKPGQRPGCRPWRRLGQRLGETARAAAWAAAWAMAPCTCKPQGSDHIRPRKMHCSIRTNWVGRFSSVPATPTKLTNSVFLRPSAQATSFRQRPKQSGVDRRRGVPFITRGRLVCHCVSLWL